MKIKAFVFYIIIAILCSSGITAAGLYLGRVLPLQSRLDEMKDEADDRLIRNCGFNVFLVVSLRESGEQKTLETLDKKILTSDIEVFFKYKNENRIGSLDSAYFLWRIKKYSKDFSVEFPEKEMAILNSISDKRPEFSGKIGNE